MREKLVEYILNNFKGMKKFRKEYEQISDKLLLEDGKMLQKLYPSKELKNILDELIGDD